MRGDSDQGGRCGDTALLATQSALWAWEGMAANLCAGGDALANAGSFGAHSPPFDRGELDRNVTDSSCGSCANRPC